MGGALNGWSVPPGARQAALPGREGKEAPRVPVWVGHLPLLILSRELPDESHHAHLAAEETERGHQRPELIWVQNGGAGESPQGFYCPRAGALRTLHTASEAEPPQQHAPEAPRALPVSPAASGSARLTLLRPCRPVTLDAFSTLWASAFSSEKWLLGRRTRLMGSTGGLPWSSSFRFSPVPHSLFPVRTGRLRNVPSAVPSPASWVSVSWGPAGHPVSSVLTLDLPFSPSSGFCSSVPSACLSFLQPADAGYPSGDGLDATSSRKTSLSPPRAPHSHTWHSVVCLCRHLECRGQLAHDTRSVGVPVPAEWLMSGYSKSRPWWEMATAGRRAHVNEQRLHMGGCKATEKTVAASGQELVVVGSWGTSGCSGGPGPSLRPLSDLGGASPGCGGFRPVVSASVVAAGGWPSSRGPRAAWGRARLGWGRDWGCSRWEQRLPPLTSTGGQCNIKVRPNGSVPHTLREALGRRNLGQ